MLVKRSLLPFLTLIESWQPLFKGVIISTLSVSILASKNRRYEISFLSHWWCTINYCFVGYWLVLIPYPTLFVPWSGLTVVTPNGQERVIRATLLLSSADLPGKSLMTNMKQFNATRSLNCFLPSWLKATDFVENINDSFWLSKWSSELAQRKNVSGNSANADATDEALRGPRNRNNRHVR